MKKRVFVCRLNQESDSFNPVLTTLKDFEELGIFEGEEIVKKDCKGGVVLRGIVDTLRENSDVELIGGVAMMAKSAGAPLEDNVAQWFIERIKEKLIAAGHLDGVVLSLHGATLSNVSEDVCGDILESIRKIVGDNCIVSVALDLHANVTEKIVKNADYVCGFLTYPHLDHYETGCRTAKMLLSRLNGCKLKTVRVAIPVVASAHAYTTKSGGLLELNNKAKSLVKEGKIADFSIFQAQPWLDVKEMASTVIVIAEDEGIAKSVAEDLAKEEFALRNELQGTPLMDVDTIIETALNNKMGKPVVLVDSADSPGAGACGDSAFVLEKLLPYKDVLRCAVSVTDEKAVAKAFNVGIGNTDKFSLGATLAPKLTKPVEVVATVRSLHDGRYLAYGPQERGFEFSTGKTAILQVGKILIHVASFGSKGDLAFYRSFGIEPEFCDLISVKACTSFRVAYEPISAMICNAHTIGAADPVLTDLPYQKRPKPLFPFEEITENDITKAKRYR